MGYNLSKTERLQFTSAIDAIPENIEYVVLRNYDDLPESVPGTDIDMLVRSDQQENIEDIFREYGFQKYGTIYTRYRSLIKKVAFDPIKTIKHTISNPKQMAELFYRLNSKEFHWGKENFSMIKLQFGDLEVDFYNHLAYQSPTDQAFLQPTMIRVDPYIEESMLENRIRHPTKDFYVPTPPDELVHLICRGVFDHQGTFRDYYISRCNKLYSEVRNDPEDLKNYQTLLSRIFYQCSDVVDTHVSNGDFNSIKTALKSSTCY